jgi:hypothetical protein
MPKRPPKKWFKRCTKGVEESGYATDPQAVCGDLWHHKLSDYAKRKIVRESERAKK